MSGVEIVFWLSTLAVVYAYAGYPLLAFLRARIWPKEVGKGGAQLKVTVVIVAHDEEEGIQSKLESCLLSHYPRELLEILVVSDGSRDRTEEIARGFESSGVRLLALSGPKGKPSALNQAVPAANGEILVLTDARQRLDAEAVRELVSSFADPDVGAVSGELHLEAGDGSDPVSGVGAYWKLEKLIRKNESRFDSTVGATGALYAVRKSLFRPLDPRIILDDVVVPMDVVLSGHRVVFEPNAKVFDRIFADRSREYRRKVRTLAGNFQLVWLRPELLDPRRNRLFLQLVSHKLSRLLVPWLLPAILLSSASLAKGGSGFYTLALALQVSFYALALIGAVVRRFRVAARIFSVPYAFLLLNLAAAHALIAFLLGSEKAAWRGTSKAAGPGGPHPRRASERSPQPERRASDPPSQCFGGSAEARRAEAEASPEARGAGGGAPAPSLKSERALRNGGSS